jgi:hypothetical protein
VARYLLSSRTVLDIIQRNGKPGEQWLKAVTAAYRVTAQDVCISAVTPMSVRGEIDRRIDETKAGQVDKDFSLDDLLQMRRNADAFFDEYAGENRIVEISADVADRWGDLLDQRLTYTDATTGKSQDIGSVLKLEIATAIVGRKGISFTYVERAQACHGGIGGLRVEDPTVPVKAPK